MSEEHQNCDFGHLFEVNGDPTVDIREKVEKGEIEGLEDVREAMDSDNYFLRPIMGEPIKVMKVSAKSQGTPHGFILAAADKFDDEFGWDTVMSEEKIFVSPQSQFHNDYIQKKQQAEQQVKQGMQSIEQLKKQKHLLEHDIRKLRSRVEDLREGDESVLKGDFIQLVDGAGAQGQGADQQALRSLRDNNVYPTIVSEFYEMDSVDDLKPKSQREDDKEGKLADLPKNVKAILKKKYTMYEKWKDMFGSEVQKKLEEIKAELRRVERALEEAKSQIEEPVRDMVMINQKSQEQLKDDMGAYMIFQRHSTEFKHFEFISSKGVRKEDGGLVEEDEDPTHYKIFYIHAVHVNIAGFSDPRTPQEGPTTAKVFWFPALVCKHTYENIFKQKKEHLENRYERVIKDYTGGFKSEKGEKLRDAREEENMSVRELRRRIGEEIGDEPPLEISALIRRVEDGFDTPLKIAEEYGDEYLEAINEILDTSFGKEESDYEPETGLNKKMKQFFGTTGPYYLENPGKELDNMHHWFKFNYYYDLKKSLGLYTMN